MIDKINMSKECVCVCDYVEEDREYQADQIYQADLFIIYMHDCIANIQM